MKCCPTCGQPTAHDKDPKAAALEIEVAGDSEDEGSDDEASAKDEILAELMEQLGGTLDEKLKAKRPTAEG